MYQGDWRGAGIKFILVVVGGAVVIFVAPFVWFAVVGVISMLIFIPAFMLLASFFSADSPEGTGITPTAAQMKNVATNAMDEGR